MEEIAGGPELSSVTLYLALIKFERFEWAVEKGTELGVTRVVPVEASRSEHGLFAGAQKPWSDGGGLRGRRANNRGDCARRWWRGR